MRDNLNIDRFDSLNTSPAPFTYESTCKLGDITLPTGSFISLKVYTEKAYRVPYRIHSIQPDGRINFSDSTGRICIYWQTYATTDALMADSLYVSSLLFSSNHIIAGHVCCTRTAMDLIRSVIDGLRDTLVLPANAFVLIPQCHIPMLSGVGRVISVDGTYLTGDVILTPHEDAQTCAGVLTSYTKETLSVALTNTVEQLEAAADSNTLCRIISGSTVYNCAGKNIIIKASMTSNLRVVRADGKITLKGVADD